VRKTTPAILVSTVTTVVCLLMLSCLAYAAPPASTQKPASQVQAVPIGGASPFNRNAPPAGTITITSPASGVTWYTSGRYEIQWNCTGSCSLVDVTLWLGGVKTFVVGTGIGSGRTSYTVPTNAAAGSYELRVTSDYDTGVEAKQSLSIGLPSITITSPQNGNTFYPGDKVTIALTISGNPGSIYVGLYKGSYSRVMDIGTMSSLQQTLVWQIPDPPPDYGQFNIHVVGNNVTADSGLSISCRYSYCTNSSGKGVCSNLQTDSKNCGWCGHDCTTKLLNNGGAIVPCNQGKCGAPSCPQPNSTLCTLENYYYCANLGSDNKNCGACGKACPSAWQSCVNGTCACPQAQPDLCQDPNAFGGYRCTNMQQDVNNCGKCMNGCGYGFACIKGSCTCPSPNAVCGYDCVPIQSDTSNCGQCGHQCPSGWYCSQGACLQPPAQSQPDKSDQQPGEPKKGKEKGGR